ncbi:MAG: hypothetical protein ABIS01_06290 [Ferruginibacter sp.]
MSIPILSTIGMIIVIYLLCGLAFAIPFLIKGACKIDDGVHGAGWGFRIIIIPATIVFWPLLIKKWNDANKKRIND